MESNLKIDESNEQNKNNKKNYKQCRYFVTSSNYQRNVCMLKFKFNFRKRTL